ncbi:MarR family winged helix-turn-helix transcriptional regulator [Finegoldia magna]|uniref:HTH-type transcriptional regulator SarZ n=1 Tax=Finegoldia magna BVS033A4 TaxID=866773 RepID=E1KZD7_FINMA|nr:MarR family transcriptional regulator [Finegoldia magna]EFL53585.1 transcriptional regulator, MarR family [Finegoldia magna BVS033A4]MDU1214056.1 MarR family transcriptional regulator [Finegoldia magna]MDU5442731.1 MarR family transcriptional regulator [Finegoldia magna]MDU5970173.1 MarR family transcriptional regulator [Finegoldia magna]OXZ41535.1 MarR family transcriptional regulator [Finegoldia magna]
MNTKKSMAVYISMSRVINTLRRENNKLILKHNLTLGQFAVMEALYSKGRLSTGEVMEKILSTSGNIPVIVKNLEKDGFITRKQDESDKRRFILDLTDKGKDLMDEIVPENLKFMDELISLWDDEDKKELIILMNKFRRKYEEENFE